MVNGWYFVSGSVYTSVIIRHLPIRADKLSIAKRLERFMSNQAVDGERWYHPWSSWLLKSASGGGTVHLIVDSTKVSAYCRQIMISVAYQRRTLPKWYCQHRFVALMHQVFAQFYYHDA